MDCAWDNERICLELNLCLGGVTLDKDSQCTSCRYFEIDDSDIEDWLKSCRGYCLLCNWIVDSDYCCKEYENKINSK